MIIKSNHGLAVVILSLVAFCVSFIADASNQSCGDVIPIILNGQCQVDDLGGPRSSSVLIEAYWGRGIEWIKVDL